MIKKIYKNLFPYKFRNFMNIFKSVLFKSKKVFLVNNDSYNEDGLATNHITDFMRDKKFISNYHEAAKGTNHRIFYRAYILNYFSEYALRLFENENGCFIELGTHKGLMAKVILLNSDFSKENTKFFLFDTFTGIPLKNLNDKEIDHVKLMNESVYKEDVYEFVKDKFSNYSFVKIIKGMLPDTLKKSDINLDNIKFLHIDLNNKHAEIESIKILYEKLLKGAPVVLDDYCYSEQYRSQKDGWDHFAKSKGFKILSLPTGQGLFFKI